MKKMLFVCLLLFAQSVLCEEQKLLTIYHDSDYSNHRASADAMRMGLATALAEVDNTIQGYTIKIIANDHRGNSFRSKLAMQQYLNDDKALFMLGGLHSPPYIKFRDYINDNQILLLVPWAAGGPITRHQAAENWVFRLSIDDTKAGDTIMEYAANQSCKQPHLLLEDTPWGKSNFKTMSKASVTRFQAEAEVTWYDWNINQNAATALIRPILASDADCLIFVGNAIEGSKLFKIIDALNNKDDLKLLSHWGITGGNFEAAVPHAIRQRLNLNVLQTCINFNSKNLPKRYDAVFSLAKSLFPEQLSEPGKMQSQAGFIHAYDLGKLVITALDSITLSGDIREDRNQLRLALENINSPVEGLLKTYTKPFTQWSSENSDAHEALDKDDFCLASYDADDRLIINND